MMEDRAVIHGFPERYTVTKSGKIFSGNKQLKTYTSRGYETVSLYIPNKGRQMVIGVHRCIGLAWIPNPDNQPFVCHKNDVRDDNRIENLYWGGPKENSADAIRNGKSLKGEKHPKAIFTSRDIVWIRENYKPRSRALGAKVIARKFNVTLNRIMKIVSGETWGHIRPPKAINVNYYKRRTQND